MTIYNFNIEGKLKMGQCDWHDLKDPQQMKDHMEWIREDLESTLIEKFKIKEIKAKVEKE